MYGFWARAVVHYLPIYICIVHNIHICNELRWRCMMNEHCAVNRRACAIGLCPVWLSRMAKRSMRLAGTSVLVVYATIGYDIYICICIYLCVCIYFHDKVRCCWWFVLPLMYIIWYTCSVFSFFHCSFILPSHPFILWSLRLDFHILFGLHDIYS